MHANEEENPLAPAVNVVIIYDSKDFATKASAMLQRAWRGLEETARWSVKPWRADILRLPGAAEEALAEAAGAHLMLLAMRKLGSLPRWLFQWLERWASGRQIRDATLAYWDGGNAASRAARASPELSRFAGRHGLSLIRDNIAPVAGESPFMRIGRHAHWGLDE